MPTKEKTYTFRAPADLAPRARDAFRTWQDLLAPGTALPGAALQEAMTVFCLAVARRAKAFDEFENQSALIRATFELFVDATEKVAEDLKFTQAYAEWAHEDAEGSALRLGALTAAADRWRDE
jgi:hypothetical protein